MIALITGITVNIVHMGKTTAQKGTHVVKDGKRHKDVMLLLLGIPPKLIINSQVFILPDRAESFYPKIQRMAHQLGHCPGGP